MLQIDIPLAKQLIAYKAVTKRRPVMFWGPSGVGKSEMVAQSCEEHGGTLVDFRASQYESVDLRGIPDTSGGLTVWNMPATIPFKGNPKFVEDDKPIYLFADEINQCDPSVASVLYQLFNDRAIGEHVLMDNVVLIAAGNRDSDRGTTNKFPSPLANRMVHAEILPSVKAWTKWAATRPDLVPHELVGFLNFREDLFFTFDTNKPTTAFATGRTWVAVGEDFLDPTCTGRLQHASMAGAVGDGPSTEFLAFVDLMDKLISIDEIKADPTGVPVPTEMDMQWAMATHVSGHMNKDTADVLQVYLERLEPEMVVMAWTLAIQRDDTITDSNAFLMRYAPRYRALFSS